MLRKIFSEKKQDLRIQQIQPAASASYSPLFISGKTNLDIQNVSAKVKNKITFL